MSNDNSKAHEIKRLTTPLTFKNSKAYDIDGNLIECVETLSDVKFIIEPKEGILSGNEIIQYAPESKAASQIRLNRGVGKNYDVFLTNDSAPWFIAFTYVFLICVSIGVIYTRNVIGMVILLILFIIPLIYAYALANFKKYHNTKAQKQVKKPKAEKETSNQKESQNNVKVDAKVYTNYLKEINNLKVLFDVKEEIIRDLIEKRFEPPQITYDKFISSIDNCHKMFYTQANSTIDIIQLVSEESPKVEEEIKNRINILKSIINQIEDLTNELVININSDDKSDEEVKNLLDEMENLVNSVKEY